MKRSAEIEKGVLFRRKPGVPTREEVYKILKARSLEIQNSPGEPFVKVTGR